MRNTKLSTSTIDSVLSWFFQAFTLVELIVVITIIGILSTIWFVSYSGYLTGTRDSNRISQIVKLTDSLQIYSARKKLPLPDGYIKITASWTLVGYQWYAWVDVLETIDYTNGWKDPKDGTYYTYYLTSDRSSVQLLTHVEEKSSVTYSPLTQTYAVDYSDRYVKVYGKKIWVLTQETTNTPAQEVSGVTSVDIVTENTNSYVAHLSATETMTWTGEALKESITNANCKRIKQMWKWVWNGKYIINPSGAGNISVYCEMDTAGGGWTLVWRSSASSTWNIWWGTSAGSINTDSAHYSLWSRTSDISFSEIMVGRYSTKKNIDYAVKFTVNSSDLDTGSSATFATSWCTLMVDSWLTTAEKTWNHCTPFTYWWDANNTTNFFFRNTATASATWWLLPWSIWAGSYGASYGAWHGKQGMVFVR